jgi:hypothetical protein
MHILGPNASGGGFPALLHALLSETLIRGPYPFYPRSATKAILT